MPKYTDRQNFLITQKEYDKYKLGDPVIINDEDNYESNDITIGYVAQVIDYPSGLNGYVITDIKLPENPTAEECAKVTHVTVLYQGSTYTPFNNLVTDWINTNPKLGINVGLKRGPLSLPNPDNITPLDSEILYKHTHLANLKEEKLPVHTTKGARSINNILLNEIEIGSDDIKQFNLETLYTHEEIFKLRKKNFPTHSIKESKSIIGAKRIMGKGVKRGPVQQNFDAAFVLNSAMDTFPNATFSIYGHSAASTNGQFAACLANHPERITEIHLYQGPNAHVLLTNKQQKQAEILYPITHIYRDPFDVVPIGYKNEPSVGQLHNLKTKNLGILGKIDQHMLKAYIFDNFDNLIGTDGCIATLNTGVYEININKDDLPDIFIDTINNNIFFKDYSDLSNPKLINLSLEFNYSSLQFGQIGSGINIQLTPELLCKLLTNTMSDIEMSLTIMSGICNLCIMQNSKIKDDFENRKTNVSESIQEVFRGCDIPLIFENLSASIKKIITNKDIFEILSVNSSLSLYKFSSDEMPYVGRTYLGRNYLPVPYDNLIKELTDKAIKMVEICNADECDDISTFSESQSVVIKSWRNIEETQKKLLEASSQIFEGDGLRTGREDAIQQSIKDVLDVEETNIKELQSVISNLKTFMTVTTLSFDDKDSSLGNALEAGMNFSVGASLSGVPQSYEAYLNRSEIFDDVKDVLQAFDIQVEKNSREYAKKVVEIYGESLGQFENSLSVWLDMVNKFKEKARPIYDSFNKTVMVYKRHSVTYTINGSSTTKYYYIDEFWGNLKELYNPNLTFNLSEAVDKIFPLIHIIEATINSSKTAKDNLGNIEPQLKKIIEDGVYKAFNLMELVQSQKIVLQLAVKCKLQIRFVIDSINNASMKGKAITTILTKLSQIETLLGYFSTFVSDCFGDNYNDETSSTVPQSSAANFSLNSFT